ncbi:MAG: MBL fold metallo-hydrolase, partial [Myxococcota bacterium]
MTTPVQVKAPEHGQWCVLKDGLYWLRQRLPFDLDHINVYALAATDGWSAVDTGINSGSSKKTWRAFQKDAMGDVAPTRLICTHLHPDHVGLAGWFAHELGAPLFMTRAEYLQCRILVADTGRPA